MKFINEKTIQLDKVVNELDRFVFKCIEIIEKHTDYVIVSGYVAILLGRNRGTDDVDLFIPKISKQAFSVLYADCIKKGLWYLNSSKIDELYDLLVSGHGIRFAEEPQVSPNIEIKFTRDLYDTLALKTPLILKMNAHMLKISSLELQIAYKEEVLKSNKDIEDARHIRFVAQGHVSERLINEYKKYLRKK